MNPDDWFCYFLPALFKWTTCLGPGCSVNHRSGRESCKTELGFNGAQLPSIPSIVVIVCWAPISTYMTVIETIALQLITGHGSISMTGKRWTNWGQSRRLEKEQESRLCSQIRIPHSPVSHNQDFVSRQDFSGNLAPAGHGQCLLKTCLMKAGMWSTFVAQV